MECPDIYGLRFDDRSKQGIERIREIREISSLLTKVLGYGTFANIFLGNGFVESSYNVVSQDWTLFAQAMRSVPTISRELIKKEAMYHGSRPLQFPRSEEVLGGRR